MFDQSQIAELLEAAKPSVIESLKAELKQTITWEAKQQAGKIVAEAVAAWVKENILPEITKQLIESKEGLVSLGAPIATQMVDAIAKSFSESIAEKLKSSWERKKLFEALLG